MKIKFKATVKTCLYILLLAVTPVHACNYVDTARRRHEYRDDLC
jgi:hypothetical protein